MVLKMILTEKEKGLRMKGDTSPGRSLVGGFQTEHASVQRHGGNNVAHPGFQQYFFVARV